MAALIIQNKCTKMFYLILGSTTGLGLILNVEQYEYMRGPQNDAGVKVDLMNRNYYDKKKWQCKV